MTAQRLTPRPTEVIQRERPVSFTFDGKQYSGYQGDTISSALWANGVRLLSRSFKYHRPRGDFAFDGSNASALVQIGDEPNVRAGITGIEEGMKIRPLSGTPSLRFDVLALNERLHRFLPVGFYYKAFHSKRLWPLYESILRRMTGLGEVDPTSPPQRFDAQYKHADVVVAGGGPGGLSAALAAASSGARVILLEQEPFLGGSLRYAAARREGQSTLDVVQELVGDVQANEKIEVLQGTVAIGHYDDHWLPAFTDSRLYKIRGGSFVVATGGLDRTLVFTNNDLPGILTASAAARLLNLYAVLPGQSILVVSANDDGLLLARALRQAGAVVTVAEEREAGESPLAGQVTEAAVPVRWRHTISAAKGKDRVTGALLLSLQDDGSLPVAQPAVEVACDTIVLAAGYTPNAGLLYQSGAKLCWDDRLREMLPQELPPGIQAAGAVAGSHTLERTLLEGEVAGRSAASQAIGSAGPGAENLRRLQELKSGATPYAVRNVSIPGPGHFRFVDFSEDVTEEDLHHAIEEGFSSIELVKRYTTISMGSDQGRYSSLNTVLLTAEARGQTVRETGTTTSRPPVSPVKMGTLAGRRHDIVRRMPLHEWHRQYGCDWIHAGRWKRPDLYHRHTPAEEVRAVRNDVGLIDVSTLGKVRLYGVDVPELLSRLYTNRWHSLSEGKVRYGVMCSEAGTIVDDGVTARLGQHEYYMTTTSANSNAVPERILWWQEQPGWHLDVHQVNVTTQLAAINVAGPKSRRLLQRLSAGVDLSNEAFPYMAARQGSVAGVPALLLRIGYTGELSYEVHFPAGYAEHVWTELLKSGQDLGVMPVSLEAMGILRLEKGHIIGQDIDPLTSPLEVDLEWIVKPDKDDFLGKVGLQHKQRNGIRRQLVGFEMHDPATVPAEGSIVVEEAATGDMEKTGWVTSTRFSPTLDKAIGLAWVPVERREPGSEILLRSEGRLHRARVASLPFYDPQGEALRR